MVFIKRTPKLLPRDLWLFCDVISCNIKFSLQTIITFSQIVSTVKIPFLAQSQQIFSILCQITIDIFWLLIIFITYKGDPWHNNSPLNDRVPDGDW